MNFTKAITEDDVIPDLRVENLEEAIEEILDLAAENGYVKDKKDKLLRLIVEREKVKPTLLEDKVLVPHIASNDFKREVVIYGRSRSGVRLDDTNRIKHFFFIGVPKRKKAKMFSMISELAIVVSKDKEFLTNLGIARNIDDMLLAIQEKKLPAFTKLRLRFAKLQASFI